MLSDAENKEPFTVKTCHVRNNMINSSLYHFIEDLRAENSTLISSQSIIDLNNQSTGRRAFLFKLTNPTKNCIMEDGYIYKESHLTVDHVYARDHSKKGISGLSLAHYTEEYENTLTHEKIIIHAYFDSFGRYSYCQIKKYGIQQTEIPFELILLIEENSKLATQLLNKLLTEKRQRYIKLAEKAAELEKQLGKIFMRTKNFQFTYKEIAKQYIKIINNLNRYNDTEIDPRGRVMEHFLIAMEQKESTKTFLKKEESESEEELEFTDVMTHKKDKTLDIPIVKQNKKSSSHKDYRITKLTDNIECVGEKLLAIKPHITDATLCIKQHEYSKEFLLLRSELLCLPNGYKINFDKIEQYIENNIQSLTTLFEKKCYQGNLEEVKILWPHVSYSISPGFYFKFVVDIILDKNEELLKKPDKENKLVAVCNFLFEESQGYRDIMQLQGVNYMLHVNEQLPSFGLLALAYIKEEFKIFEMLLEHKLNADSGILYNGRIICLSKFLFDQTSDPKKHGFLVDLFIKHKVRLEGAEQVVCSEEELRADIPTVRNRNYQTRASKQLFALLKRSLAQLPTAVDASTAKPLDQLFKTNSCLEVICSKHHLDVQAITNLANNSSLKSVVISLATLCNRKDINTRLINTEYSMLASVPSRKEANQLGSPVLANLLNAMDLTIHIAESNTLQLAYSLIFYPNNDTSESLNASLAIGGLIEVLGNKITAHQEDIFTKNSGLYYELSKQAIQLKGNDSVVHARSCMLLLLMSISPMIDRSTIAKKIMQMYGIIGNRCLEQGGDNSVNHAMLNYREVCAIGYNSSLKHTQPFQHSIEQYIKLSNSPLLSTGMLYESKKLLALHDFISSLNQTKDPNNSDIKQEPRKLILWHQFSHYDTKPFNEKHAKKLQKSDGQTQDYRNNNHKNTERRKRR